MSNPAFLALLQEPIADRRFLVELAPYDPATGALRRLYYSSHGFTSGAGDGPGHTHYEARVTRALTLQRSLFEQGKLSGRTSQAYGEMVLSNMDGALDFFLDLSFAGRDVTVLMGGPGFPKSDYGVVFKGTAAGIELDGERVVIKLRDYQHLLDKENQTKRYAGTGGPQGSSDMTGRLMVFSQGIVRNISPVYLGLDSGGRQLYDLHQAEAITGVLSVKDDGVELTFVTGTPTAGQYSYNAVNGTLTLGGTPSGLITCDVIGGRPWNANSLTSHTIPSTNGGSMTFTIEPSSEDVDWPIGARARFLDANNRVANWLNGDITAVSAPTAAGRVNVTVTVAGRSGSGATVSDWRVSLWGTTASTLRWLASQAGVTSFDTPALRALNSVQTGQVGLWVPEGGNTLDLMDYVANGGGVWYGFTRDGKFTAGRVEVPSTTPVATFDDTQILAVERQDTADPPYEITVRYQRNWTVMKDRRIAASVPEATRTFLTEEWRQRVNTDTAVSAAYRMSQTLEVNSLFDVAASATGTANRLRTLYGTKRHYFRVTLKTQTLTLELGQTVQIIHKRFGLSVGRNLIVVDMTEDLDANETVLGLWG